MSALFSSPLPSPGSYHIIHITQDIRHQDTDVSIVRGSACIPLLPCTWEPQGSFGVQFNSPAFIRRITFLLQPCWGQCLPPALSHTARNYNPTVPAPACSHFSCICPCGCPCARGKGELPSARAKSSPCPAREVMAKASPFFLSTAWFWGEPEQKEGKGSFLTSCGRDKQNLALRLWIWLMSYQTILITCHENECQKGSTAWACVQNKIQVKK